MILLGNNKQKKNKKTFDFELFANLTTNLLSQVFQLLAERSVRYVRLKTIFTAQLQQGRITDVIALFVHEGKHKIKRERDKRLRVMFQ